MKYPKLMMLFALLIGLNSSFSQEKDASLFTAFQTFFNKEIKHQGVKGDWLFGLKEVTGTYWFDLNDDKLRDVLMVFTAEAIDGGGGQIFGAVLFKARAKGYSYIDFITLETFRFEHFENGEFQFRLLNGSKGLKRYVLQDGNFVAI